jgi:Flp pilus assembly protein TadD
MQGTNKRREGGTSMVSVVFMVTVVLVALILLVRRGWWRTRTAQLSQGGVPLTSLALEAFMQGNAYLAEENFPEATAAFHRARELDPKRPHVVDRLAEVARRQHAATATRPAA